MDDEDLFTEKQLRDDWAAAIEEYYYFQDCKRKNDKLYLSLPNGQNFEIELSVDAIAPPIGGSSHESR